MRGEPPVAARPAVDSAPSPSVARRPPTARPGRIHTSESKTIGYLAIHRPAGGGAIDLDGTLVPYHLQSLTGDEHWSPALSHQLRVEEECSKDSEVDHCDETLHVLALGAQLLAQQVNSKAVLPARRRWLYGGKRPLLHSQIRFHVLLVRRFHAFTTEPERDHGQIDARLEQVHGRGMTK